jgi:hypothetical protein
VVDGPEPDASAGSRRMARTVAVATGVVALASLASLIAFFVVEGPFGTINDIGNATVGILSAVLALVTLRSWGAGLPAVAASVVGAVVTVIGSTLVMTGTTGFILAGFVSNIGFALIGAWLVAVNRSVAEPATWSPGHRILGLVAGAAMAIGSIAVVGALMGVDSFDDMPAWLFLASVGWLGTYILMPIWCLRLPTAER